MEVRVLAASRGHFSVVTVVYQAAENKTNGCSVESGPGYLGSMSVCCAAQWVIKRDLAIIHILRLHKMLKNLLEKPKKIPGVDLVSVEANEQSVVSRSYSER